MIRIVVISILEKKATACRLQENWSELKCRTLVARDNNEIKREITVSRWIVYKAIYLTLCTLLLYRLCTRTQQLPQSTDATECHKMYLVLLSVKLFTFILCKPERGTTWVSRLIFKTRVKRTWNELTVVSRTQNKTSAPEVFILQYSFMISIQRVVYVKIFKVWIIAKSSYKIICLFI